MKPGMQVQVMSWATGSTQCAWQSANACHRQAAVPISLFNLDLVLAITYLGVWLLPAPAYTPEHDGHIG
jgi:hypothetical protein